MPWDMAFQCQPPGGLIGHYLRILAALSFNVDERGETTPLPVRLSAASTFIVTYAISDGTASAATDYTATTATLTFASGQTSVTTGVPTPNDSSIENNESL